MSISFGGLASGLPVNEWIDKLMQAERIPVDALYTKKSTIQTQKTTLSSIEGKISSLRSSMEKLTDSHLASVFDLFAKKTATSSDTSVATASAENGAAAQNVKIKVDTLATSTKAITLNNFKVGKTVEGDEKFTTLGNGQGKTGKFTIYTTDGVGKTTSHQINVTDSSTLDSIATDISAISGLSASVDADGNFNISYNGSINSVKLGGSGDTSNFFNITQLSTVEASGSAFKSRNPITSISTYGTIIDSGNDDKANLNTAVTEGVFMIGKATFKVDSSTRLNDLISEINSNNDAGVIARYDLNTNKITLTSKNPGNTPISMQSGSTDSEYAEEDSSNFLTAMGLITVDGDSFASQAGTLGTNAKVYLNDSNTALYANSNTLTSDITGINGLTINLLKTSDNENVDINVNQDTTQLVSAVSDFISKFNDVINTIDTNTGTSGKLKSEYRLVGIRNDLRQTVTSSVSGLSKYDSLAMIGITTGSIGTSTETKTNNLQLDSAKFLDALSKDPETVKKLLIGDPESETDGTRGVMQKLLSKAENLLDPSSGYFNTKDESYNTSIADIEKSIIRGEDRLAAEKKRLTNQFAAMDKAISDMQQQGNALLNIGSK